MDKYTEQDLSQPVSRGLSEEERRRRGLFRAAYILESCNDVVHVEIGRARPIHTTRKSKREEAMNDVLDTDNYSASEEDEAFGHHLAAAQSAAPGWSVIELDYDKRYVQVLYKKGSEERLVSAFRYHEQTPSGMAKSIRLSMDKDTRDW